ncbi:MULTISPECIES: MFS transporter [unclassified Enterococcus]|uniref:MFS transporter n=1 Tax=unclassified Enterococcus TaxID=2608891 RepID=UPI0013EDB04D|nr:MULTISPECIES: MFS transporter [unclassified Enterococcus]
MFGKLKQFGRQFTETTPFILSNTVIFIPYLLFMGLSNGFGWQLILPFTLFYTFRMTGLFLISGIRFGLDSYTLLMISLLIGGAGSLVGIFGMFYFPLFYFSSVLLGLSAAWLVPANVTVNRHEKQQGYVNMKGSKYFFALFLLFILFRAIELPYPLQAGVTLSLYTVFYIMAYHTVSHYPRYELDFKDIKKNLVVTKELVLFAVFFVLLFVLRNARLLVDTKLFDFAIFGFLLLFIVLTFYLGRARKNWKLPDWLNLLTFLNGMIGNFLFLFSTIYIGRVYGFDKIAMHMYVPYITGMLLAKILGQSVLRRVSSSPVVLQLAGMLFSLFVLLIPHGFIVGLFLLSFWHAVTGSWLNQEYYAIETAIPADRRVITKYTTQNKGSVIHQFLLMTMLFGTAYLMDEPLNLLLRLTGKGNVPASGLELLIYVKWLNIGLLILGVISVYVLWKRGEKHASIR